MSVKTEFSYDSADGITRIRAVKWLPDAGSKPAGVLQIVHGMQEFIDRYDAFASFLTEHGYIVVGCDLLGHGASIRRGDERYFGYFGRGICPGDTSSGTGYTGSPHEDARTGGHRILVSDIRTLQSMTADEYPQLPYYMLGHSMGSFLAREYLCLHGGSLSGAVISGTAYHSAFETVFGRTLAVLLGRIHGWFYRSPFLDKLSVGSLNKEFEPARTRADWLTRDEQIVDQYVADRRTQFPFTCNGFYTLFDCLRFLTVTDNLRHMPKKLPVLLISGAQDPVGSDGTGPKRVAAQLQSLGMKNVVLKIYPQMRHEVLNEIGKQQVWEDVLSFLESSQPEQNSAVR